MKLKYRLSTLFCLALAVSACGSDGTETVPDASTIVDDLSMNTTDDSMTGNGDTTPPVTAGIQEPCEGSTGTLRLSEGLTLSNVNTGTDYLITCTLEFSAGTLTIEPETEIVFEQNTGVVIKDTAEIRAMGGYVADVRREPSIVMRGNSASGQPSWNGLLITSPSIDNFLENVEIHDAGFQKISSIFFPQDASALVVNNQLSIKGLTIDNSGGIGIYNGTDAVFGQISDVLFGNTASHPIHTPTFIAATQLAENKDSFVFTQQEQNNLQSIGMYSDLMSADRLGGRSSYVFEDLGIPYYSYSGWFGNGEIGVQVQAGVDMIMAAGVNMRSGGGVGGRLSLNGTADAPITLRGAENLPGFWSGIEYRSNSALNVVSHVNSSDAVNGVLLSGNFSNNISATVTDSNLSNTSECGIKVINPLSSLTFETSGNTYLNNGQGSLGDAECFGNHQE